jgi:hypothetical protein
MPITALRIHRGSLLKKHEDANIFHQQSNLRILTIKQKLQKVSLSVIIFHAYYIIFFSR